MGCIFTLEPDYYEIYNDEFNIETHINQFISLANDTNTIIKVLEHIQNTETTAIMEQVDGYISRTYAIYGYY